MDFHTKLIRAEDVGLVKTDVFLGLDGELIQAHSLNPDLDQATSLIVAGLGAAALGFGARYIMRTMPKLGEKMAEATKNISKIDSQSLANSKYYKGGFDPKMTRREAALILGVSPTVPPVKLKAAYKRLILINHPDKGGSPYISAKISEARDMLEKK